MNTVTERAYRVGDASATVIRAALLMRGYTIRKVATEIEVHPNFVMLVLKGFAKSRRVEEHINSLLTQPIPTT